MLFRSKVRACSDLGLKSEVHRLGAECTEAELIAVIEKLNRDPLIHGVLLQLPLPRHLDAERTTACIVAAKDVDGFSWENLGALVAGHPRLAPCTALGVMAMIEHEGVPGAGYPFAWALLGWLDGHDLCAVVLDGPVPRTWADDLADLVTTLRAVDVSLDPPRGARGGDVATRAAGADDVLTALAGEAEAGYIIFRRGDLVRHAVVHVAEIDDIAEVLGGAAQFVDADDAPARIRNPRSSCRRRTRAGWSCRR